MSRRVPAPVWFPPLEAIRDHNGRIRYIEKRFPDDKPNVWYQYVRKDLHKCVNDGWGISGRKIDASVLGFP